MFCGSAVTSRTDLPSFVQFQFQVVSLLHQLFIMLEEKEIIDSSTDFSQTNKMFKKYFVSHLANQLKWKRS